MPQSTRCHPEPSKYLWFQPFLLILFQVPSHGFLSLIKLVLFAAHDWAKDPEQAGLKGLHYEQSTQYWLI